VQWVLDAHRIVRAPWAHRVALDLPLGDQVDVAAIELW
jgi:hypothetical protein